MGAFQKRRCKGGKGGMKHCRSTRLQLVGVLGLLVGREGHRLNLLVVLFRVGVLFMQGGSKGRQGRGSGEVAAAAGAATAETGCHRALEPWRGGDDPGCAAM